MGVRRGALAWFRLDHKVRVSTGPWVRKFVDEKIGDFTTHIADFNDGTYEKLVHRILERKTESNFHTIFATQYDNFTSRIANLLDDLIAAVKLVNEEFIIWLKTHPDQSQKIHADAFEQLTGEILTSHGFTIQFTGRIKNRSADLIAIEKKEKGEDVKYLVECKRYAETRKVGIDILNAVVGASFRAKTSHAMLVTTSSFTPNVFEARAELEEFRLDLHDGKKLTEWLKGYEFREFGLWLPDGWEDEWAK
jgi:HJR/Mrr/RecB family endonuclease